MADKSLIEWTDATWNPITGCTLVDDGCRHCYAAHLITSWPAIGNHPSRKGLARKNAAGESKFTGEVRFNEGWIDQPLRWKKPRRIFVCAHGDLFHPSVPDEWIDKVFAVMALASQHTFQVLTKRPERAREYLTRPAGNGKQDVRNHIAWEAITPVMRAWAPNWTSEDIDGPHRSRAIQACNTWPLPNIWLGTSISDQASADLRITHLLACPAAIRFISAEPLLGPVDLTEIASQRPDLRASVIFDVVSGTGGIVGTLGKIDWVICGGESGPHARPMHPDWARSLRDQCVAAGVPFLYKQNGEYMDGSHPSRAAVIVTNEGHLFQNTINVPADLQRRWGELTPCLMTRVGKKAAGRVLDGVEWLQFPEVEA